MYAVIKTGGKQYKVTEGDVVRVEKLALDAGQVVAFDEVLMLGDGETSQIGSPNVVGASVKATVLEQERADKIVVFKKRRRQNSRQKNGHRQAVTVVRVTDILGGPKKRKAASKKSAASSTKKTRVAKSKKAEAEEKSASEE
ncbi:MAG: 50S ribosomal protein L21 [Rhodospirillaceae bacterium]|nr:50S ribosomal protein L21 [Rhodospirillaceae bacterium]|tara:strand:- start:382 stop:807 length:426 start_codon:yes stop_codon:yes gene_type:complete